MNHEKDIFLRRCVEAGVVKVRVAKTQCRSSVITKILKKWKHWLGFNIIFSSILGRTKIALELAVKALQYIMSPNKF